MKIEDIEVVCAHALCIPNTWYIFRINGTEVTITKIGEMLSSNKKLTDLENEYLENNLR